MKLPQVTLRELFLLVVIAAMGCGWWVDRQGLVLAYEAELEFYRTPIEVEVPSKPAKKRVLVDEPHTLWPSLSDSEE